MDSDIFLLEPLLFTLVADVFRDRSYEDVGALDKGLDRELALDVSDEDESDGTWEVVLLVADCSCGPRGTGGALPNLGSLRPLVEPAGAAVAPQAATSLWYRVAADVLDE